MDQLILSVAYTPPSQNCNYTYFSRRGAPAPAFLPQTGAQGRLLGTSGLENIALDPSQHELFRDFQSARPARAYPHDAATHRGVHRRATAHHSSPEQSQLVPSAPQLQFITRKLAPSAGRLDRAATHGAELLHAVRYPASRAASRSEELASSCSRSRAARGFRSRAARYSDDPDGRRCEIAHIVEGARAARCLAPLVARGSDGASCGR